MRFLKLNLTTALSFGCFIVVVNNKINRLHERYLRITYNDKHPNFEELLHKVVTIHYNNIHALAIELYKIANGMSNKIMNEVFKLRHAPCYNLWHTSQFSTDPIHSVYNRTEAASYLGPKVSEQIPGEIKNKSLDVFKREIKKWKPVKWPCRICRTFVPNLGFIR